ncbi:MAG: GNAT family N-acetyltransferase [Marmoricola sp.]
MRGLSDAEVQRLCNVNYEHEVAFVATSGSREAACIVAQSCYFIDPTTNLADVAYMVHPDWQGAGLGSAMQANMIAHAQPAWFARFCGRCTAEQCTHVAPGAQ